MDKAIEIKRRAQRCILNGDLDGALKEYEKLVSAPEADPYHSVLLADLLYKKGDQGEAAERYFGAVDGYEQASLHKNAIAVCKKMSRLSLAPARVLQKLATLHELEGLSTESSLYFMQHAELMVRGESYGEAIVSLRQGFEVSADNMKALERLGEVQMLADKPDDAAKTLLEAAELYNRQGQFADAVRCQDRAEGMASGSAAPSGPDVEHGSSLTPETGSASEPIESAAGAEGALDPNDQSAALRAPADRTAESDIESVLDIDIDIDPEIESNAVPQAAPTPTADITIGSTPEAPGLQFEAQGGEPPVLEDAPQTIPLAIEEDAALQPTAAAPDSGPGEPEREGNGAAPDRVVAAAAAHEPGQTTSIVAIGKLLNDAQNHYAHGERDAAGAVLVSAAQAYDDLGHYDSAASIYTGLYEAGQAPMRVLVLWLENCKVRGDLPQAAHVACQIGDLTMTVGDVGGAKEWFERAQQYDQNNEKAAARLERLASLEHGAVATAQAVEVTEADSPDAAIGVGSDDESAAQGTKEAIENLFLPERNEEGTTSPTPGPLASEPVPDAGPDTELGDQGPPDLGWLISQFQRGVAEQLANDCRAHYDLGVSYREMGLLDESIESFREAGRDSKMVAVATEMLVRSMLDQGRLEDAVAELRSVLAEATLETGASVSLYYQMGLALEAGGRQQEALEAFECVSDKAADYADVVRKIQDLRLALGRS